LVSYLSLKRFSSTPRFLRGVWAIRKQLSRSDGLVGYTLRARPLSRDYWTLSVWDSEEALSRFVETAPHVQVMGSLQPLMRATKFRRWTVGAADGPPEFAAALGRLAAG
jgi:hypothetical protein